MKFFRYRRPSWKTILGLTQAKKQVKKALGITALLKPFRWWTNLKRRFKRKIGYESTAGRIIRNGLPKPAGCLSARCQSLPTLSEPVTGMFDVWIEPWSNSASMSHLTLFQVVGTDQILRGDIKHR
jgi:hypothetical protein